MKKRFLSLILVASIFTGLFGVNAFAYNEKEIQVISLSEAHKVFTDVDSNEWYYDYVDEVYKYGLFSGTDSNTFSPNTTMTRGMFATAIYNMYYNDGQITSLGAPYFTDVKQTDYYYDAVTWCYNVGIVKGTDDTNAIYEPEKPITRQEAAAIMGRRINLDENSSYEEAKYTDSSDIASWALYWVDVMATYDVMTGYEEDGSFRPESNMTRAECSKVISMLYKWMLGIYDD